jgi:TonB family protein
MSGMNLIVGRSFRGRLAVLVVLLALSFPLQMMAGDTIAIWSDGHISNLSDEELTRYATTSPGAGYPEAAQKANLSGSGVYELQIDKSGRTTAVVIVKSSKSAVLDQAARSAFLKWRFKPGVFTRVRVPVSWSVNRVRE